MSEAERIQAMQAVQLRLFELAVERKELKQTVIKLLAQHKKRCRRPECASRGEEMQAEQFYVDERYSDNLYPYCRECKTAMVRAAQKAA